MTTSGDSALMSRWRLPLGALAAVALVVGLWSGLVRMGWGVPTLAPAAHGPLMIGGFLGTVICLERAVAFRRRWAYAAPLLAGLGGLALIAGLGWPWPQLLLLAASAVLLAGFLTVYRRYFGRRWDWPSGTLVLAAGLWVMGNALWLTGLPLARVTPWWVAFLVLTVAGERLDLARVQLLRPGPLRLFGAIVILMLGGLAVTGVRFELGVQLVAVGLVSLGLWLLRHDVTRRTIRQTGLPRYVAACLLPGYAWLVVTGALWLWRPDAFTAGPTYDALLHAVLVGFVLSMIFGHAPIILPAIAGIAVAYTAAFYLPLVLLHASLLLRLWADLTLMPVARQWGGLLNVVAVALFAGVLLWSVASAARARSNPPRPAAAAP